MDYNHCRAVIDLPGKRTGQARKSPHPHRQVVALDVAGAAQF
jgi:hypothetical protein